MEFFKKTPKFDFMGKARIFIPLSLAAVVLSLIGVFTVGPKWGIDFEGGTEVQVSFQQKATSADIRQALARMGFGGAEVVTFGRGENEYLVRLEAVSPISPELAKSAEASLKKALATYSISKLELSPGGDKISMRVAKEIPIGDLEKLISAAGLTIASTPAAAAVGLQQPKAEATGDEEGQAESSKRCESVTCTWPQENIRVYETNLKGVAEHVMDGLRAEPFGKDAVKLRSEWVGPKAGGQLRMAAVASLAYAMLFIMLYVAVRFDFRFGPGGVIAIIHDVVITLGVFTVLRLEVTLTTVAALLTIAGYSINDTIVVFDRIRENMAKTRERSLMAVINNSINETLSRTIISSFVTLLTVIAMLLVGWKTSIRDFMFALFIGIIVGTYSSVFIASPWVIFFDRYFGKKKA
jgi:preprotein translocase subunit SecF